MQKILLLIVLSLLTSACSNKTKKSLGIIETMPDEYQVKRNKSLEVPPHYRVGDTRVVNTRANATLVPAKKQQGGHSLSKSEEALLKEVD